LFLVPVIKFLSTGTKDLVRCMSGGRGSLVSIFSPGSLLPVGKPGLKGGSQPRVKMVFPSVSMRSDDVVYCGNFVITLTIKLIFERRKN
jgi:hypothetical protein